MNPNFDEIDNLFVEYFDNYQEAPNLIANGINSAISTKNKQYKIVLFIKKIIITITGLLTLTGGVVFAKDIKNFIEDLVENIFGSYNNGITTAIENGYIENIDMQYINSNNTKVKVDQITLDDYNLGIVFHLETEGEDYTKDLFDINFKNILIMDENNNVLFSEYENQEDFIKYCEENKLDKGNYGIGYANCGANGKILEKKDNNIIYSFYTTSEKFPKSKKLTIKFDKIYLLNNKVFDEENNVPLDNRYAVIDGNWEMNIDLEKMKDERETIEYSVFDINDMQTKVTKASLSMSNMRLELITNSNKIDFKKLQNREKLNVNDMIPFHDAYIETENGEKFFESNSGNNGYNMLEDGKIQYYTNFDYTYFNKSENIKIVLPTNKKQDLVIELKANN